MHVYLRWYSNGRPGQPQKLASESDAQAAIWQKFSTATFGQRVSTMHQPAAMMLSGIGGIKYAYQGKIQPDTDPVADILFPAP